MAAAGQLRHRCAFYRPATETGGLGPQRTGWESAAFMTVWGRFLPGRGRELIAAGRIEARRAAELIVRNSPSARSITTADSVVIDGERWNIRQHAIEAVDRSVVHMALEIAE